MSESLSLTGLLVALTLPWLCGCIWTDWLLRRSGRCNVFIVLGQGFFLGIFFTTLLIRLWDVAGFGLNFMAIAATVFMVAAVGLLLQRKRPTSAVLQKYSDPVPAWHFAAGTLLIALIVWRHVTLCRELLLRPLYAWDAWMNWAPKAIVWFHHGALVDFVGPQEWLERSAEQVYSLGNPSAVPYPIAVPLIQLWTMLGFGTWDHGAVYLFWILAPISLGLALFGHLRLAGVPFLMSIIACYLLMSMPFLNVHSVLAGYADIWLASAFCLAVCALYEWRRGRHWGYGVLWLVLALLCSQLKEMGVVLAAIIFVCGAHGWFRFGKPWGAALLGAGGLSVLALVFVTSIDLPVLEPLGIDESVIDLGKLWPLDFRYHEVGAAFLETCFVMLNWNLLWYLPLPYIIYRIYSRQGFGLPGAEVLAVALAAGGVGVVFVFSKYYVSALDFVALNRVLLYVIPALVFCMFLSFARER